MTKNTITITKDYEIVNNKKTATLGLLIGCVALSIIYPGILFGSLCGIILAKIGLMLKKREHSTIKVRIFLATILVICFGGVVGSIILFCLPAGQYAALYAPFGWVFGLMEQLPMMSYFYATLAFFVFFTLIWFGVYFAFCESIQLMLLDHNDTLNRYNSQAYMSNQLDTLKRPSILIEILRIIFAYSKTRTWAENVLQEEKAAYHVWKNGVLLTKDIIIPANVLKRHVLLVGTNGSGKTVTMLRTMKYFLKNNLKYIYLDMKGSPSLIKEITTLCKKENKSFAFFSPFIDYHDSRQVAYDPFKNKPANEVISLLLEKKAFASSLEGAPKDSDFWRVMEKSFLEWYVPFVQILIGEQSITLAALLEYCDYYKILYQLAIIRNKHLCKTPEAYNKLISSWEIYIKSFTKVDKDGNEKVIPNKDRVKTIDNCQLDLQSFANGSDWIGGPKAISISDFLKSDKHDVILFSIDPLRNQSNAKIFGKMIMDDLKQNTTTNLLVGKTTGIGVDEYNVVANENNIDLINKGREFLYSITLSVQTLADLDKISSAYKDAIISNTNTLIVHKVPDIFSSDECAKLLNLGKSVSRTFQGDTTNENADELSEKGTYSVEDSFIINPNELRQLGVGYAAIRTLDKDSNVVTIDEPVKIDHYTYP